jgi:DNA-binding NarL/FixJ family response regulator
MPVKVVVFEDNFFLRNSLAELIRSSAELELKGAFENCNDVREHMRNANPDIVLMDIEMKGTDGLEGLRIIKRDFKRIQVMMLTVFDDNDKIFQAICDGASGYLLKNMPYEKIIEAIIDLYNGGAPMTSSIARKILQSFSGFPAPSDEISKLTSREHTVLQLLGKGNSYKMIAADCNISIETVRTYIKRIYEKLQVHSATEAIAKAFPFRKP